MAQQLRCTVHSLFYYLLSTTCFWLWLWQVALALALALALAPSPPVKGEATRKRDETAEPALLGAARFASITKTNVVAQQGPGRAAHWWKQLRSKATRKRDEAA